MSGSEPSQVTNSMYSSYHEDAAYYASFADIGAQDKSVVDVIEPQTESW